LSKRAAEHLPNLGIELIDVRIKSINYVPHATAKEGKPSRP
jgi:hypothetical protein